MMFPVHPRRASLWVLLATVLLALNRLWRTGVGVAELAALGLALGADVPVFVLGTFLGGVATLVESAQEIVKAGLTNQSELNRVLGF